MKLTKQEEKILRKILSVFLWILAGILVVTAILIKPVIGLVMFGLICYFGGIVLILLAISKKYIGYGRMRENSWICLENNERFVGMKIKKKTLHFKMGDDNVARWEIEPKDGGQELEPLAHIGPTAIAK